MRSGRVAPKPGMSASSFPIGRIAGISIQISVSWLLSVAIITILATPVVRQAVPDIGVGPAIAVSILLAVLLGASVLIHELGHCLAARSFDIPVMSVRLYLLGGVSELGRTPASAREEAIIAAAGPGLSAILGGIFAALVGSVSPHTVGWLLLVELALSNLVVAVFNILPALPLDGGRVLRAGVWQLSGRRRAGTFAAVIGGYVTAAVVAAWGIVVLFGHTRADLLEGGLAVVMAAFVAVGAAGEHRTDRAVSWPSDLPLASLARSVLQLPMESPVALALQAAGGRAVILTGMDGIAVGLMDDAVARALAATGPSTPSMRAATPIGPEMVVLADDDPAEVLDRARAGALQVLILVNDSGHPVGVVSTREMTRILAGRRAVDS